MNVYETTPAYEDDSTAKDSQDQVYMIILMNDYRRFVISRMDENRHRDFDNNFKFMQYCLNEWSNTNQ